MTQTATQSIVNLTTPYQPQSRVAAIAAALIENVGIELASMAADEEQFSSDAENRDFDQFRADALANELLNLLSEFLNRRHPLAAQMTESHAASHFKVTL